MAKQWPGNFDAMTLEQLEEALGTSIKSGLTASQAESLLRRDGPNELRQPPKPSLLAHFALQLTGFVILLLLAAGMASVFVNASGPRRSDGLSYTTGGAVIIIVVINAGIAAWSELRAGGALEALSKMTQASIGVLRDGSVVKVDVPDIVRGDIVILSMGDVVPADVRLVEASDLRVCEMALTGEPDEVVKAARASQGAEPERLTPENMALSGCSVTSGSGRGVVVHTGMQTRMGRIAQLISGEGAAASSTKCGCLPDLSANATPLQQSLEQLGGRIGVIAIGVCTLIFIIGVAMERTDPASPGSPSWLYMILIAVTLAVAAIPEGIPLCVTISLSIACSEMVGENVLVKRLAAVETLGSASVICTDKTGTITEGRMTMVNMWAGGATYDIEAKGFDPTVGRVRLRGGNGDDAGGDLGVRSTLFAATLCCNATVRRVREEGDEEDRWEPEGDASEVPIVVAARKVGFEEDAAKEVERILEVPVSSSRRMMLTVSDVSGRRQLCDGGMSLAHGTRCLAVVKGAPYYVMEHCTEQLMADGSTRPLSQRDKLEVMDIVDHFSSHALRVLAIATREFRRMPFEMANEWLTSDDKLQACRSEMKLLGLVASIDPSRDGVLHSVLAARAAGIRVVMITGDSVMTALAMAHRVGILQQEDDDSVRAVDSAQLRPGGRYLTPPEMDILTANVRVFARAFPEDKLEIVKSLQRQGAVTAMTGDGVSDAPALSQADIGVAMGIAGTAVAKGAADMVLMDDDFCSIVRAVQKGRSVYAGIQKFVAFIMSVHIAEVLQIFVCIVTGIPVMRTPLQILFLILVTDLPPSIALAMEPAERAILEERPRPRGEPVVLGWMWVSMLLNGVMLSAVIIAVYIGALVAYCDGKVFQADISALEDYRTKLMDARTVAFISLVWAENVRAYSSRSFNRPIWHGLLSNIQMQRAILTAQICLYLAVLLPFFSENILQLRGVEIGIKGWFLALIGPVGCLLLCEMCKLVTIYQAQQYQKELATRHAEEQLEAEEALARHVAAVKAGAQRHVPQGRLSFAADAAPAAAKGIDVDDVALDLETPRLRAKSPRAACGGCLAGVAPMRPALCSA